MMTYWLTAFLLILSNSTNLQGVIVTSPKTPKDLTEEFSFLLPDYSYLSLLEYSSQTIKFIQNFPPTFIVDATSSISYSYPLKSLSSQIGVLLVKLGKPEQSQFPNEFLFYSSPSFFQETQALKLLISHFNWDFFHVFSSQTPISLESAKLFKQKFSQGIIDNYLNVIPEDLNPEVVLDYLGRLIKPSGNWKMLIFNQKQSSQKIMEALESKKMLKKGCGVVLKFSGLKQIKEGMIIVAQQGTETAKNFYSFQVKQTQLMINMIQNLTETYFQMLRVNTNQLRDLLKISTINGSRIPKYLILNSKQDNQFTQIGTIQDQKVNLSASLTLPGGQTQFTNDILQIRYSQNSGYINHLGQIFYPNIAYFAAIWIYRDIINEDDSQLENFQLVVTQVNCGSGAFYYDYFKECFQNLREQLGLFYIHSPLLVTYETVELWREMGISTFQIGIYPNNLDLFDTALYKQIVFSSATNELLLSMLPTFLVYQGWKNIIAIQIQEHNQNERGISFYKSCQNLGVKIKNSEQTRVFPDDYSTQQHFEDYKNHFQQFYDSGVRVFVFLEMWEQFLYIVQSLYKIGFRQGDIQILSVVDILSNLNANSWIFQQQELKKIYSLINGSLMTSQQQYNEEFQQTLKPIVQQFMGVGNTDNTCVTMDILQLGSYAVNDLLITGRDYENPDLVNESTRIQRFKGCSGTFSIDSSSNQRRDFLYFFGYILLDPVTGEGTRYKSGTYSAVQNPLIQIYADFQYCDGSNQPPSDMRYKPWNCDFPQQIVQTNIKSQNLTTILLSLVVGVSIFISSVFAYIFKQKLFFQISKEMNMMGFDDIMVIFSIGIENIQYLIIGPDFSKFNPFIYYYVKYLSIDFLYIYSLEFETFWIIYYIFLGVCSIWIILIVVYFFTLLERITWKYQTFFRNLGEQVMPGLASIFIIPVLQVLFQVTVCENGISQELKDSFMNIDCHTFCWQGDHKSQAIGSLAAIMVFIVFTLTYRSIHSFYCGERTIQIYPLYTYIKGLFQVTLSVLSLILKKRFQTVFNILFSFMILVYLFVTYRLLTYNYKRIQLIQVFAICGIFWSMFLTNIFELTTKGEIDQKLVIVFFGLQTGGWIVVFIVFLILFKKEPRVFLKLQSRHELMDLFRFMFGKIDQKVLSQRMKYRYSMECVNEEYKDDCLMRDPIIKSTHNIEN